MYSVSPELYQEVAARLADAVDGKLLFGIARIPFRRYGLPLYGVGHRLTGRGSQPKAMRSLFRTSCPYGGSFTFSAEGEMLNDFDFSEMKRFV
ncbi:MAG: hypothetical protein ACLUEV_12220 [Alistipes sp.]